MSNVGSRCLIKLGKPSVHNSLSGIFYKDHQFFHASNFALSESSTYEKNYQDQSEQIGSSFSSYHQFHRHSYERKRTDYQKERARHKQRTEPLLSKASVTHYQRLSVDPDSDIAAIKSAYYVLSKQYHPDVVGGDSPEAIEQFRLITESYDILSDPASRKEYDSTLGPKSQTPQFTSWQPPGSSTGEHDHIFRMREANRIIKSKQDTFLERERLKNPQKFRSGSFKADDSPINAQDQLDRLDKQMQSLSNHGSIHTSSSNFYRMHMVNTIRRRREDLLVYRDRQEYGSTDESILVTSILTVIGGLAFLSLVIVNQFFDIDIAGALDRKLEHAFKEMKVLRRRD